MESFNNTKHSIRKLIISSDKVTCISPDRFRVLEMNYVGDITIFSLLSNNYVISKSTSKIIILNFNTSNLYDNTDNQSLELFKYKGTAIFSEPFLATKHKYKFRLTVETIGYETWDGLSRAGQTNYSWDYMTRNWEDLSYDGKNNKISFIKNKVEVDNDTNIRTVKREIRKK